MTAAGRPVSLALILCVGVLAGCTGAPGLGSTGSPFKSNPEDFLHDEDLDGETSVSTRFWRNGLSGAKVDFMVEVEAGEVTVRVVDNAMNTVWSRTFDGSPGERGSAVTEAGQPGDWRVEIDRAGAVGELHLKVAPGGS